MERKPPLVTHQKLAPTNPTQQSRPAGESPKCANFNKWLYNAIPWVGNKLAEELKLSSCAVTLDEVLNDKLNGSVILLYDNYK